MPVRILILEGHAVFGEALRSALLNAKMDVLAVLPGDKGSKSDLDRNTEGLVMALSRISRPPVESRGRHATTSSLDASCRSSEVRRSLDH